MRFELLEALRSRLLLFLLVLYGGGAAVGSWGFLSALNKVEEQAREEVAKLSGVAIESVPKDLVKKQAGEFLARFVDDKALAEQLLQMEPLAIFYGFLSLNVVALLVLLVSAGTIATDVSTGAVRFALPRCDRVVWTAGKALGHAALLLLGLLVGALATGLMGVRIQAEFPVEGWWWLGRMALRTWCYGLAFLGLFLGVSQVVRSSMAARAASLLLLILLGVGHGVVNSGWMAAKIPFAPHLGWLFPAHHQGGLWSPHWGEKLVAVAALLVMGVAGFCAGQAVFQRRDA